jgi:predicted N-acetyltransferase YhbS
MNFLIRPEKTEDYPAIKKLNDLAFHQPDEGMLIEKLRLKPGFIAELSLVAEYESRIVGHILFTPIQITNKDQIFKSLALAPMAVLPEFQKKGIGKELVMGGLNMAACLGFQSVIVLGHKDYYPKFGFRPASNWQISAPYEVPDECFLALELSCCGLKGISGTVEYPPEFDELS